MFCKHILIIEKQVTIERFSSPISNQPKIKQCDIVNQKAIEELSCLVTQRICKIDKTCLQMYLNDGRQRTQRKKYRFVDIYYLTRAQGPQSLDHSHNCNYFNFMGFANLQAAVDNRPILNIWQLSYLLFCLNGKVQLDIPILVPEFYQTILEVLKSKFGDSKALKRQLSKEAVINGLS